MRVIISGGGTAGHINPAVAIANYFLRRIPMNAKKILAVALVALLAVASFAPAFAADKENVMLNAEYYDSVNITPDKGDYFEVSDEMIAAGL